MAINLTIKRIMYPRYSENITEIEYSNIDVTIELENGSEYVLTLATAKNLEYVMDVEQSNYFEPGCPIVIVKALTKKIIIETIKYYVKKDDGYWLKLYNFAADIDPRLFKQLEAEAKKVEEDTYAKYKMTLTDKELKELFEVYEGKDLEELDNS